MYIYELIFRGEDPQKNNSNPEFWDEFFLLPPNVDALETELKQTNEHAAGVKQNLNELFNRCTEILDSDHPKRAYHGLQTLAALIYGIFRKEQAVGSGSGFDLINTLIGFDEADDRMKRLIGTCNRFLTRSASQETAQIASGGEDATVESMERELADQVAVNEVVREMCLKLLLVLVTGTDNVSQNVLLEYMMVNNCRLFEALVQTLSDPVLRQRHGHDTVILMTVLVNYRKYESANPYIVQLSLLADELALNGYSQVISAALIDFCRQYASQNAIDNHGQSVAATNTTSSWFSSLSNIVGNMFVSDEGVERVQQIRANNALLLALYEAIHLNRNFITTLAQTQAESSAPPSPSNTLTHSQAVPDLKTAVPIIDVTQFPTNLLVAVFQYCSIVMQDHKNESSAINLKLCFLILTCIAEDQYANSMMHDVNLSFKVGGNVLLLAGIRFIVLEITVNYSLLLLFSSGGPASRPNATPQNHRRSHIQAAAVGSHAPGPAGRVHCVAPDEEVPHGAVPDLYRHHSPRALLPEAMPGATHVSVEGAVDGPDCAAQVPRGPGAEPGQEVQYFPLGHTNRQHIQPVHHVRRHIPGYNQQLRRTVLRAEPRGEDL